MFFILFVSKFVDKKELYLFVPYFPVSNCNFQKTTEKILFFWTKTLIKKELPLHS